MTEALEAIIDFAFFQMNILRIEAIVNVDNISSIRLLERLGFQKEGLPKDYNFMDGRYISALVFSLALIA